MATGAVSYDWVSSGIWWTVGGQVIYPGGKYMDRFSAQQRGLLLLHAGGNTFIRDLADGERIYVSPHSLVYKDLSAAPLQ